MRQAARTVPIAGTAWGRALLASCLHMLAADIPGNQKKKISDNLQYTAYFKSRPQVPVQTVFHYLSWLCQEFFFKRKFIFFFIEFWRVFKLMYSLDHASFIIRNVWTNKRKFPLKFSSASNNFVLSEFWQIFYNYAVKYSLQQYQKFHGQHELCFIDVGPYLRPIAPLNNCLLIISWL